MKNKEFWLAAVFFALIGSMPLIYAKENVEATDADVAETENGADQEQAKLDDINKLMELTNVTKMGGQILDSIRQQFMQQPGLDTDLLDKLIKQTDTSTLVKKVVPLYNKHFTHDDIKGLIKFYETPLGKKMIEKQTVIAQESMKIGQEWAQQEANRIMMELQAVR